MKKQSQPFVSVIIPVYNAEENIKVCIRSVLRQNYTNYEVIIVDNNSRDRTKNIIENFQKLDKKIRYLFEKTKGRGVARNSGEKASRGSIILMTDSDCVVPKNWIKEMIKPIIEENFDVVQGSEENSNNYFWSRHMYLEFKKRFSKAEADSTSCVGYIDSKNLAIKSKSLIRIGYTEKKYQSGNDTSLSIKINQNNLKVKFLNYVSVLHNHSDSLFEVILKQFNRARWTTVIYRDNKKFLKNSDFPENTAQTFNSFFRFFKDIIIGIITKDIEDLIYEFTTGISWRAGIVYGKIFVRI